MKQWLARPVSLAGLLAVGLGLGGALAGAGLAGYALSNVTSSAVDSRLSEVGNELLVNFRIFSNDGTMLLSTFEGDRSELEETADNWSGPFVIPDSFSPKPYIIPDDPRPIPWTNGTSLPIGHALVGKSVGEGIYVSLLGQFPGFTETVILERTRGPFNKTYEVSNHFLETITTHNVSDSHIEVDDLFNATILESKTETTTIRLDVEGGHSFPVRRAGFEAEIIDSNTGNDEFSIRLHTVHDHQFSLVKSCTFARYVLQPGSYIVTNQTADEILLTRSSTKIPQLMEIPLTFYIEIHEFGSTDPGGDELRLEK